MGGECPDGCDRSKGWKSQLAHPAPAPAGECVSVLVSLGAFWRVWVYLGDSGSGCGDRSVGDSVGMGMGVGEGGGETRDCVCDSPITGL